MLKRVLGFFLFLRLLKVWKTKRIWVVKRKNEIGEGKLSKNYVNCSLFSPFPPFHALSRGYDDYYGKGVFWASNVCMMKLANKFESSGINAALKCVEWRTFFFFFNILCLFNCRQHTEIEFHQSLLLPIKWFVQLGTWIILDWTNEKRRRRSRLSGSNDFMIIELRKFGSTFGVENFIL